MAEFSKLPGGKRDPIPQDCMFCALRIINLPEKSHYPSLFFNEVPLQLLYYFTQALVHNILSVMC